MRRRVWCETLGFDELPVSLLARARIDLLLAVRPWQLAEVGSTVARCHDAGVFVGVWPMLDDADGRWASVASVAAFIAFADAVLVAAPLARELVIDLEPPIAQLARLKAGRPVWLASAGFVAARDAYAAATRRWSASHRVTTAILPMLLAGRFMERAMGTPASTLAVERHSVMAYTSLFEGLSRGLVNRRRAEQLLAACAKRARSQLGPRAALSLGTVGTGAFGDEPCYRDAGELARDVELARAAGIDELAVFDLGGIVRRPPSEAWLDALGS